MKRSCLFLFIVGGLFIACSNDNSPDHIKEVIAYKQGVDGVMVNVVLADKNGNPTTAEGILSVTFTCDQKDGKGKRTLYADYVEVKAEDFKPVTVGTGASKHEALAYSFGRISYAWFIGGSPAFERFPQTLRRSGNVSVEFYDHSSADYKYLKGVTTLSY